jgi:Rrf2 family protein
LRLPVAVLYALHALAALARHGDGRPLPIHAVAAAGGLSLAFLRKIMASLSRAGLLAVQHGPGGGARLGRPAKEITLLEIVEAVDGPLQASLVGVGGRVGADVDCRLAAVCQRFTEAERKQLARVSLGKLIGAADGKH